MKKFILILLSLVSVTMADIRVAKISSADKMKDHNKIYVNVDSFNRGRAMSYEAFIQSRTGCKKYRVIGFSGGKNDIFYIMIDCLDEMIRDREKMFGH